MVGLQGQTPKIPVVATRVDARPPQAAGRGRPALPDDDHRTDFFEAVESIGTLGQAVAVPVGRDELHVRGLGRPRGDFRQMGIVVNHFALAKVNIDRSVLLERQRVAVRKEGCG